MATLVGTGIVEYRHEWCNCGLWNIDMNGAIAGAEGERRLLTKKPARCETEPTSRRVLKPKPDL